MRRQSGELRFKRVVGANQAVGIDSDDPEIERVWGEEALRRLRVDDEVRLETVSLDDALRG